MPRFRNIFDYSSEDPKASKRPEESIVEIFPNDSVKRFTVHIEPNYYVQLKRIPDSDGQWQVTTNLDVIKTRDNAAIAKA